MPFLSPDQRARLEFVFKYYDTEMKGLLPIRRLGTVRKVEEFEERERNALTRVPTGSSGVGCSGHREYIE